MTQPVLANPPRNPEPKPMPPAAAPAGAAPVPQGTVIPTSFSAGMPSDLSSTLSVAQSKQAAGDLVAARQLFSRVLADARTPEADRATIRRAVSQMNEDLVFSPRIATGDPFVESYVVQSGDRFIKIAQALKTPPDYRLISRINRTSAQALRVGQKLKIINAPFHAVVSKSAFRLDVWMGPADKPEQWVYVRSFSVGLGAAESETPMGTFVVKKGSKLVNPPWTHPKTGEHFEGGSATNPLGKFWIGLEGTGESASYAGYGIHGTIEPDSIGERRSMGCVRLADADIALMYELMGESLSTVRIVP
jgi:lipoprotein-anchoring transpeptidase ErfK/SrfK